MKTIILLIALSIMGITSFAQNDKRLVIVNNIITNTKGKVVAESPDNIKTDFYPKFALDDVKMICDTTAKSAKALFNWRINYDKNYEKEFMINGKHLLITIYFNDKFLYFEFY